MRARVIVPLKSREEVLKELHQSHIGIVRMKMLSRSYVWWPKIDSEIEKMVKSCIPCEETKNAPAVSPLHVSLDIAYETMAEDTYQFCRPYEWTKLSDSSGLAFKMA